MVRRSSYIITVLVGLLLIIGGALTGYAIYQSQQNKIDDLKSQVTTLKADLKTTQAKQQKTSTQPQQTTPTTTYHSTKGVSIVVYQPTKDAKVTNPLAVVGEVPGLWSFEASFPVVLKNSSGKIIAHTTAQVLGDWTADGLVPFSAKVIYSGTPTGTGILVLQKDNPSGLASNEDSVSIPVRF